MNSIRIKSPATVGNVGPGYDIFALSLSHPYDEIEVILDDTGMVKIEVENDCQNIPTALNDNTAGLAILELLKRYNLKQGMTIRIIKKMKSGGGMGTTGASAAAAVYGTNEILKLNLSMNEMIDIARMGEVASGGSPHADNVAASLLGGFVLVKNYKPIDVLKIEMPEFPVVFAAIKKVSEPPGDLSLMKLGRKN